MVFNKKNFNPILLIILFVHLMGLSSAHAGSECYKIHDYLCKKSFWGKNHSNCKFTSEKDWEVIEFNKENLLKSTISELDEAIKEAKDRRESTKKHGYVTGDGLLSEDLHVCLIQETRDRLLALTSSNQVSKSNQPSNSGASSSQSNSSQSSTQTVVAQGSQQATQNKSGKNSNDVTAKCIKLNHNRIVNMCKFPINFSFCMLHQDDQSIQVANSCNDGFESETVYPGRSLSDESLDTRFFSIACKHPSKPINMRFISFNTPPEGTCSK